MWIQWAHSNADEFCRQAAYVGELRDWGNSRKSERYEGRAERMRSVADLTRYRPGKDVQTKVMCAARHTLGLNTCPSHYHRTSIPSMKKVSIGLSWQPTYPQLPGPHPRFLSNNKREQRHSSIWKKKKYPSQSSFQTGCRHEPSPAASTVDTLPAAPATIFQQLATRW